MISSISREPELFSSNSLKMVLARYSIRVRSSLISMSSLYLSRSPRNAVLEVTLFKPLVSDKSPMIAFGITIPIRQPMMMPTASPQIGVSSTFVMSEIIAPVKVDTKVPSRSEYVLP